jgi:hypothetical protein
LRFWYPLIQRQFNSLVWLSQKLEQILPEFVADQFYSSTTVMPGLQANKSLSLLNSGHWSITSLVAGSKMLQFSPNTTALMAFSFLS